MFLEEIYGFIRDNSVSCRIISCGGLDFVEAEFPLSGETHHVFILPVRIDAASPEEASMDARKRIAAVQHLKQHLKDHLKESPSPETGIPEIITLAEDRWRRSREMYAKRLLSHLGICNGIFARNCETRKIDRMTADAFMNANHAYGAAACRHCYGLFEKKSGTMVAAAAFSNARRWRKKIAGEDEWTEIRSFEWVRYASLAGTRVAGGMGKVLNRFVKDLSPDDVMSYADTEWSGGAVYEKLGFEAEGSRQPVMFRINTESWERIPLNRGPAAPGDLFYENSGSIKYRLKLFRFPVL